MKSKPNYVYQLSKGCLYSFPGKPQGSTLKLQGIFLRCSTKSKDTLCKSLSRLYIFDISGMAKGTKLKLFRCVLWEVELIQNTLCTSKIVKRV